jgi:H+/Cl- antiporter ClcA
MKLKIQMTLKYYAQWIVISAGIGVAAGFASAVFLGLLEKMTETRLEHPWLLFFLPLGGLVVGFAYNKYGKKVQGGNNLLIDEFHDPQAIIPFRMAPLVLVGTLVTHLFGGSAGREGTAVQMGGSIADQIGHVIKVTPEQRRVLLMAGMAGGFGSVFGVPFAGTIFGLEVLAIGQLHLWALVECAVASFVANAVTLACGIHHAVYVHPSVISMTHTTVIYCLIAGVAFGLAARLFAFCTDQVSLSTKKYIKSLALRSFFGGAAVSLLFYLVPELTRYAGLGVPLIVDSLKHALPFYDWFGKLIMTALTLGVGFKGGEVTPLLFVGSTLGNAMSPLMPIPLPILAAMGFVGVFAGAANTPFACTLMAMELFGPQIAAFAALACFASYLVSGHHGIYHSQKIHIPKTRYASRTLEFLLLPFKRSKDRD